MIRFSLGTVWYGTCKNTWCIFDIQHDDVMMDNDYFGGFEKGMKPRGNLITNLHVQYCKGEKCLKQVYQPFFHENLKLTCHAHVF